MHTTTEYKGRHLSYKHKKNIIAFFYPGSTSTVLLASAFQAPPIPTVHNLTG